QIDRPLIAPQLDHLQPLPAHQHREQRQIQIAQVHVPLALRLVLHRHAPVPVPRLPVTAEPVRRRGQQLIPLLLERREHQRLDPRAPPHRLRLRLLHPARAPQPQHHPARVRVHSSRGSALRPTDRHHPHITSHCVTQSPSPTPTPTRAPTATATTTATTTATATATTTTTTTTTATATAPDRSRL